MLQRTIEPWASPPQRLMGVETFAKAGVMMAPVIPRLDDDQLMEAAPSAGAVMGRTRLRWLLSSCSAGSEPSLRQDVVVDILASRSAARPRAA